MLKILASIHTMPDVTSYKTRIFENILPILRNRTKVHVTWLVYTPDKLNLSAQNDPDSTVIDIHDYKNAVEIIQNVKPDIIYGSPTLNLPDHALTLAGNFLGIPVVGEVMNQLFLKTDTAGIIKSYITAFFEKTVPTDVSEKQQKFMRRGRFFVYKYLFLLRTQVAVKMNLLKIIKSFFVIIRVHLTVMKKPLLYDSYFSCTLHFVESESLIELLLKEGFKRSSLVVTGIPQYDLVFKRLRELEDQTELKDNKIHVLLLTHSMYEHGIQTKTQRDSLVKGIVSEICKYKNRISLVVKIHPSSEVLWEYQSLINSVDPNIPVYQKGDVLDFIEKFDVVISYSTSASTMQALILKKPVIFCNFFNLEGDIMLERNLAYDCRELSSLIDLIEKASFSSIVTKEKMDDFIKDFFYKDDGCASERVCDAILKLVEDTKHNKIQS